MAITNAQQYQQLVNKPANGKRLGYKGSGWGPGAGSPGTTKSGGNKNKSSSNKSSNNNVNTGNAREDYITNYVSKGKVKGGGKKKTGPDFLTGGGYEDYTVTGDDLKKAKKNYEQQFYDKGQVPPLGSRPTDFRTRLDQRNKQKRLDYVNRLIKNRTNKILKGLELAGIEGVTEENFDELYNKGMLNIPSVADLVEQGFYKSDGPYATGEKIPDFTSMRPPGLTGLLTKPFEGPLTTDRIDELLQEKIDLQNLKTTEGIEGTSFNELMETYEPNRFELQNPPTGGDNASNQSQVDPCKGPNPPAYCNVGGDDDTTPPSTGVFAGIAPRFAGSIFDFDALRAGAMDGGMIEDTPVGGIMDLESGRQMYFLGKLVKKATRAVKKVAKSPFGKAALGAALFKFGGGFGGGKGLGSFFGKGSFNPLKALITKGPQTGMLGSSGLGKIFGKFGLAKEGDLTLGGKLGLGFGVPFALDLLGVGKEEDDGFDLDAYYKTQGIDIDAIRNNPYRILGRRFVGMADGGRIGLKDGPSLESILEGRIPPMPMPDPLQKILKKMTPEEKEMFKMRMEIMKRGFIRNIEPNPNAVKPVPMPTYGPDGKRSFAEGGDVEPVAKKTMPLIDMDGQEKDYRETGGFVDMGRMERADDVPARLSKNEFVFTADAVRNAGEGDIDKGAEVMYNMMKNLEAGGEVSEESQGLEGARKMFQTSQRLGEVL